MSEFYFLSAAASMLDTASNYVESYELLDIRSINSEIEWHLAEFLFKHKINGTWLFLALTLKPTLRSCSAQAANVTAPVGKFFGHSRGPRKFFLTPYNDYLMTSMIQDHTINKDICIIGEKGMGKTALAREFAGTAILSL